MVVQVLASGLPGVCAPKSLLAAGGKALGEETQPEPLSGLMMSEQLGVEVSSSFFARKSRLPKDWQKSVLPNVPCRKGAEKMT